MKRPFEPSKKTEGHPVRFQTALDRGKALKQYEALRRSNMVSEAVVIARLKDGSFHVLGQNLKPEEIATLLVVGAEALAHAEAGRTMVKAVAHVEPAKAGVHAGGNPLPRSIKTAPDGTLVPPEGESFTSCGECGHPQWFVTVKDDGSQGREVCSHCLNEVKPVAVFHRGGTA